MITKEKFEAYLRVQNSGATNMFAVSVVVELSDGHLTRSDCLDIMKNYEEYSNKFGNDIR